MQEKVVALWNMIINFIKEIPLSDLLVGVVVPIMAAWISYYLAERAMRKKENNRLYVQIELIRKELKENDFQINKFVSSIAEKNQLERELQFPLVFMKTFLLDVLDNLQTIKTSYMYSTGLAFEKPKEIYLLAQRLEEIDSEISDLECKGYSDDFLDEKRKIKILELTEEKEQKIEKLKKMKDRDIYKEFLALQSSMERQSIEGIIEKLENKGKNFDIAKYIYESIKTFNQKPDKTKEDVVALYKKLVIFEISSDVVKEDNFDQDTFDLYYRAFERPEGMERELYDLCERYYKYNVLKNRIEKHTFEFKNRRWNENNADFVIINDRNLYISIIELYEKLEASADVPAGEEYEEKNRYSVECHDKIQDIIGKLELHELKLQKKCK